MTQKACMVMTAGGSFVGSFPSRKEAEACMKAQLREFPSSVLHLYELVAEAKIEAVVTIKPVEDAPVAEPEKPKSTPIEVGKKYRRRDGEVVMIIKGLVVGTSLSRDNLHGYHKCTIEEDMADGMPTDIIEEVV